MTFVFLFITIYVADIFAFLTLLFIFWHSPLQVSRERIRVLEFMRDYDKLRSGRMLKTSFRRALDLCRFELRESEASLLEDR